MINKGLSLIVWVCFVLQVICYSEDKVSQHFAGYDRNGDGRLERSEYVKVMQE